MKNSKDFQKTMNTYLVKKQYRLAYAAFLKMNKARLEEGLDFLTMPNLQSRFE